MSTLVSVSSMFTENTSHGSDRCRALVNSFSALLLMRNTSHSCEIKGSQTSSTEPTSEKLLAHTKRRRGIENRVFKEFIRLRRHTVGSMMGHHLFLMYDIGKYSAMAAMEISNTINHPPVSMMRIPPRIMDRMVANATGNRTMHHLANPNPKM